LGEIIAYLYDLLDDTKQAAGKLFPAASLGLSFMVNINLAPVALT
jgi:hypothetical protein